MKSDYGFPTHKGHGDGAGCTIGAVMKTVELRHPVKKGERWDVPVEERFVGAQHRNLFF
jgi:hypothetical protein